MNIRLMFASIAVAIVSQVSALADVVTFTFNAADDGLLTIVKTVGGLTLTLEENDSLDDYRFRAEAGGLVLASNRETGPTYFYLYFDKPVTFVSYTISLAARGGFDIYSDDGNLTTNPLWLWTRNFDTLEPLTLSANTWALWNGHVNTDDPYALIQSLTVEVVPEPSSVLLLSSALIGGLAACRRLRKKVA